MESKFMDVMAEMFEVDANELSMDIEYKNYEKFIRKGKILEGGKWMLDSVVLCLVRDFHGS